MIHNYKTTIKWTGNIKGQGTSNYSAYERAHEILVENKAVIHASSDPAFRGDPKKHNPEELFLASISSCHMLWYLHLCASEQISVLSYIDNAKGVMIENKDGSGHFTEVTLNPYVLIKENNKLQRAIELHHTANQKCFIANSCNFTINHEPQIKIHE